MSSRGRAFNEVKDLLGKLDRGIDEARKKRLHGDEPEEPAEPQREPEARPEQPGGSTTTAPRPGASPYGRARPLRRGDENGSAWRTP
ncbi:MAG: hypothetical protein ACF8SC_05925 [Phycisphaerales bacterium JB037]